MIITTTDQVENRTIAEYGGIVSGGMAMDASILQTFRESPTRPDGYTGELRKTRDCAIKQMVEEAKSLNADAVIGVKVSQEAVLVQGNSWLVVTAIGTTVELY